MVKTAMNRFGWRLPFLAAAMLVFAMSLALFGGETRAVIAAVVFDDTQPLLETADAPTLLSDVLGVSEQRRDPPGHTSGNAAHGSVGYYEMKFNMDPNAAANKTSAATVTITVDDLEVDGMTYDGSTADTSSNIAKDEHVVELCVKVAASPTAPPTTSCGDGDTWADTVTLYFGSVAGASGDDRVVGLWSANQRVSVRAVDDNIDDVSGIKKVQLNHAYARYGGKADAKLTVTVTDEDDRSIMIADASTSDLAADSDTVGEGTVKAIPIKLETRPQVSSVDVTMTVTQSTNGQDTADDVNWLIQSGSSCPAFGDSGYGTAAAVMEFNKGSSGWDTNQHACIEALDDSFSHSGAGVTERVVLTFTATDDGSAKTDYGGAFIRAPADADDPDWWDRTGWTAPVQVVATLNLDITDDDTVGVTFYDGSGTAITDPDGDGTPSGGHTLTVISE